MRRLIPTSTRCGKAFVRYNSGVSEASSLEDLALVNSFSGIVPKLTSAYNTLINTSARTEFKKLCDNKVLFPNYAPALLTFCQLQNPVLKKYKFDPAEFAEGATEAFKQLHLAMASTDFNSFISGASQESPAADLLKSSLSPYLYDACAKAARHLNKEDKTLIMTEVNVNQIALVDVETFIHFDLLARNKELIENFINAVKSESTLKSDATTLKRLEAEEAAVDAGIFPEEVEVEPIENTFVDGSVIVRASVMYEAQENYADASNLSLKHSRLAHSTWTFEGCISGQTDLDWKVVAFDGIGGDRGKIQLKITKKPAKESESEKETKNVDL